MASGVPRPGAGAGRGGEAHAPRGMPGAGEGHSGVLHGQRLDKWSSQAPRRRDPGEPAPVYGDNALYLSLSLSATSSLFMLGF